MIKDILLVILIFGLAFCLYLLIDFDTEKGIISIKYKQATQAEFKEKRQQFETTENETKTPEILIEDRESSSPSVSNDSQSNDVIVLDSGLEETNTNPSMGIRINQDKQLASRYKIIGPKKFKLVNESDKTIVEIDLQTGKVDLNPEYSDDESAIRFWKSVGEKYPEVCYTE